MKKASKIIMIICCILTIISMISIQCYAWQNTNEQVWDIVTTGGQSYNLTPIKAIYMNTAEGDYTNFYTRSVQHQNVYTVAGKSNFVNYGYELSKKNTEVQNAWSNITFEASTIPYRFEEDEIRKFGYLTLREDDITNPNTIGYNTFQGTCFDEFTYDNHISSFTEIRRANYVYQFNTFTIAKTLINENAILYLTNYYIDEGTVSADILIDCIINVKNEHGVVQTIPVSKQVSKTDNLYNTDLDIANNTYSCYYANFDIFEEIREYIPNEAREIVQIHNLQITVGGNWEDPQAQFFRNADKSVLHCQYIRPYAENYNISEGETEVIEPFSPTTLTLFKSIDQKNNEEFIKGGATLNMDGFNHLGNSIGGTVDGIMGTEILPDISLWTILLIPLSLGIIFAVLRYFAGG